MKVEVHREIFELCPERALFWPATKTIVVADLHWGKAEVFQAHGLAIPTAGLEDDLGRLDALVASKQAERVLVLGDLVHSVSSLRGTLFERLRRWREGQPVRLQAVVGNHDRGISSLLDQLAIENLGEVFVERSFQFSHALLRTFEPENYSWSGHVHPSVQVRSNRDSLKLPCFVVGTNHGVLPAFSFFTGGAEVRRKKNEKRFAIAGDKIVEL